jgi:hypothetical protein
MKTLKEIIYNILLNQPECRDSDKKLIWEVWRELRLICLNPLDVEPYIYKEDFMKAPSTESCRRVRQQLQREDLLLGKNLIQPTPKVKKQREQLSKSKGFEFQQGYTFNPLTQTYEM